MPPWCSLLVLFVFGPRRTTEALGAGLTAWYTTTPSGFEQGFTVSPTAAGEGRELQPQPVLQQLPRPGRGRPGKAQLLGATRPGYGLRAATSHRCFRASTSQRSFLLADVSSKKSSTTRAGLPLRYRRPYHGLQDPGGQF